MTRNDAQGDPHLSLSLRPFFLYPTHGWHYLRSTIYSQRLHASGKTRCKCLKERRDNGRYALGKVFRTIARELVFYINIPRLRLVAIPLLLGKQTSFRLINLMVRLALRFSPESTDESLSRATPGFECFTIAGRADRRRLSIRVVVSPGQ